jgi:hypothetical protein
VYLIPGFFGFVNFGRLVYFSHVREFLEHRFDHYGIRVEIHRARPMPVASLRRRTIELADYVQQTSSELGGPLHLVGHSAGGLDARLLVAPGVDLGEGHDLDAIADRVRTVTTVCTPHRGTPLASSFTGVVGGHLLRLLSVLTVAFLREGQLPLSIVTRLGRTLVRSRLPGGRIELVFEELEHEIVKSLPEKDRLYVSGFFEQVAQEQALIPQLMPENVELFNATTPNRKSIRYASVAVCANEPNLRRQVALGVSPYDQAAYGVFRWLHAQTASSTRLGGDPAPAAELERVERVLGRVEPRHNDGIVPVLSQLWGEVVHVCRADHLDVVGHFSAPDHEPPHFDWLPTASGFTRDEFERLWDAVARQIAGASSPT